MKSKDVDDDGKFGSSDGADPYYDNDFKQLELFESEIDYAKEEKEALKAPLKVADMQKVEEIVKGVQTEVSGNLLKGNSKTMVLAPTFD